MFCRNCGEQMNDNQGICLKCGVPTGKGNGYCPDCGAKVSELAVICVNCGKKLVDEEVQQGNVQQENVIPTEEAPVPKKKKKKILIPLIIGGVVVVALGIFGAIGASDSGSSTPSVTTKYFDDMYPDLDSETWCEISYDGTWMTLDTNPYDIEDSFNSSAWYKIKSILTELGFSSSVAEEMNQTRALDGRQTATHGRYEVSWTYHPDSGLEVMFKIK